MPRGWSTATCTSSSAHEREPVLAGNVHDADDGPEGPPSHPQGALTVER